MIPKIIHYCWFGPRSLGELELSCIQSWREVLPEYEIKLWNEDNFDYSAYPFAAKAYQLGKFAFVSDVCRLHALYVDGGVYLDTDMLVLKEFSSLLDDKFFISEEKRGLISAGIIGAEKEDSTTKKLLDGYKKIDFDYQKPLSIPSYLTSVLDREEIKIYPSDYFYPLPFSKRGQNFESYISTNTYAVHLWNYSWRNEWSYLHEKKFGKSIGQFFAGIKHKGLSKKDGKFFVAFAKFWFADKFSPIYVRFKKLKNL